MRSNGDRWFWILAGFALWALIVVIIFMALT